LGPVGRGSASTAARTGLRARRSMSIMGETAAVRKVPRMLHWSAGDRDSTNRNRDAAPHRPAARSVLPELRDGALVDRAVLASNQHVVEERIAFTRESMAVALEMVQLHRVRRQQVLD